MKEGDVEGGKSKLIGKLNEVRKDGVEVKWETHVNEKKSYECKICGNFSKSSIENKKHLSNNHSKYAVSIAKEYCAEKTSETSIAK